ncbi:PQQ-binding-like beta-propeller repeat protein [Methylophilus sp. 5]|uniref:pyrroloquinoline quinone-dependent dehydrogenase n=1 Tax=Methylophilus sp. 5 TaxID=1112274 RepID=UPI0004B11D36|nr:PQQ-binding-like beta-propeller repeat protein [Methylophilus sp. 5]
MKIASKKIVFRCVAIGFSGLLLACTQAAKPTAPGTSNVDWPSYGLNMASQRFSALTQINDKNVASLQPAWSIQTGVKATFQATPIVVNGIMYISLPFNHVLALDAATGKQLWKYTHTRKADWPMCCGPANRGVAVAEGKVFIGTVDARLIALDANSGNKLWDIDVAGNQVNTEHQDALSGHDPNKTRKVTGGTGVGIAMAPVVYQHKVIVGITGVGYGLHIDNPRSNAPLGAVIGVTGRYGRPGFLAAFDVNDGHQVWQFDTIPKQGWEGRFTTQTADGNQFDRDVAAEKAAMQDYPDAARFGGGSAWSTPAIDTATNTLYFGTGNPSPQMNDVSRPGDNLYSVSLVALDTETGQYKWHYQQVPHDLWGYDLASPPVLFNYSSQGKTIAAVGQASKTGWFYINDRASGQFLAKSAPFVPQHNLFKKPSAEGTVVYPGILGGANWSPVSLDEAQQRVYVAAMHSPIKYTVHETELKPSEKPIRYAASEPTDDARWGLLSAIDLQSGRIAWQHKTSQPLVGGVLATAGGLLFCGEGNGTLAAYHSQTGKPLWQYRSEYGVNAPPITYQINGEQYIAVASGGNSLFGFEQGDRILTFKLPANH